MTTGQITAMRSRLGPSDASKVITERVGDVAVEEPKRLFYPYQWSRWSVTTPSLWGARIQSAWCLVDECTGLASTADAFTTESVDVDTEEVFPADPAEVNLDETARRYVCHAAIQSSRALSLPSLELIEKKRVHRPFWLIQCRPRGGSMLRVVVDAVTGKYQVLHPGSG
jgi:hypothetical protein